MLFGRAHLIAGEKVPLGIVQIRSVALLLTDMIRLSVIALSALSIIYACSPPVPPNLDPDKTAGPALDRQVKLNRKSSSDFRPPQVLATWDRRLAGDTSQPPRTELVGS